MLPLGTQDLFLAFMQPVSLHGYARVTQLSLREDDLISKSSLE